MGLSHPLLLVFGEYDGRGIMHQGRCSWSFGGLGRRFLLSYPAVAHSEQEESLNHTIIVAFVALSFGGCTRVGGGGGASGVAFKSTPPAADELTRAMTIDGSQQAEGAPVGITLDPVDQGSVEMSPGQTGSLTMNADEVSDPSDPVVAKLVYMGGALTHLKVPLGTDAASATPFTVASDVCKNLCTVVHQVQCFEAAVTESGTITQANLTNLLVNCTAETGAPPVYSGNWTGDCGSNVAGSFQLCVTAEGDVSGSYSGDSSGSVNGDVSTTGSFKTGGGEAGECAWTGQLGVSNAQGTWTCAPDCSGTWSGAPGRRQQPTD